MLLLPFENYILKTTLPIDEVKCRLEKIIEPKQNSDFSFGNNFTKPYKGQIFEQTFEIIRNINYQNSFRPIIFGKFEALSNETFISIKMRMHSIVLIITSLFPLITGIIAIVMIYGQVNSKTFVMKDNVAMLMFVSFYIVSMFAFKSESKNSIKYLRTLLGTQ